MRKIETLFKRDPNNMKLMTRERSPDAVSAIQESGPLVATWKWDGSACLVCEGKLYRRHVVKSCKARPPGWMHWSFNREQESGHGWAPVDDSTADQYHREAWDAGRLADGTYELVGPKVQGNPYDLSEHQLWKHGTPIPEVVPLDFDAIRVFLAKHETEGIVWWSGGEPVVKIKRRDFGLPWPVKR